MHELHPCHSTQGTDRLGTTSRGTGYTFYVKKAMGMPQEQWTHRQRLSKSLFGQVHRLDLMIYIAESKDGLINPTELSFDLRLPQSALQAPLRDLTDGGLLVLEERRGRRLFYRRVDSAAWDWVRELKQKAKEAEEARAPSHIKSIRS